MAALTGSGIEALAVDQGVRLLGSSNSFAERLESLPGPTA
ncbi:hypothetical protein LI90_1074 [Carbonactinospora thermoautotrophica]|uniref:Uncharacterized protein n=1 Tax=Carbonactinospora thermoautotrophica TaxID=1469144 RepID=A0A132MNZ3_9ACTN|nr:hypothetical protein LI90_1074 [Carbonactinospora thermoautotrophica]